MPTLPNPLLDRAATLLTTFRDAGLTLATAESCTGGLIAACLTELAGSSDVFERGFVTYANEAKIEILEIAETVILEHGAVSEPVARDMALGALEHSRADIAVAVTGIAGPSGGSAEKPVGLVFIASARRGASARVERHNFPGDRTQVREATVLAALDLTLSLV